ncbi:MAG: right-handed parallel beta-helix repeat-containing protein [Pseudomonadota bacterium]
MNTPSHSSINHVKRAIKKLTCTTAMTAVGFLALSNGAAKAANDWSDHTQVGGANGSSIDITVDTPNSATNITQNGAWVKVQGDGDIKSNWSVNLTQDSSSSKYILYDIEGDATRINGNLNANGEVWIFDQDGVIFGANSKTNVGALVASTGSVADSYFENDTGEYVFDNIGDADVINRGEITVAEAGLAAFVAPTILNSGKIKAKMGKVAMAAGEKVTLDLYGDNLVEIAVDDELADGLITNTGDIVAKGGEIVISARIAKSAVEDVINLGGLVTASSAQVQGGKIVLSGGDKGRVNVRSKVKANGNGQNAGSIDISGERIRIAEEARLRANAGETESAGNINVIADKTLILDGRVTAQGMADSGFIETSAPITLFGSKARVLATREWLLDPTDVTIDDALATLIEGQLAVGDMTVQTPVAGTDPGDIVVSSVVDWSTDSVFSLVANNDITIILNGGVNATGAGNFVATAGGDFRMLPGNSGITTNGGDVTINTADEFTISEGFINANGGDITIDNAESFEALEDSLQTSGEGNITLNQNKDVNGEFAVIDPSVQNAVDAISNTGTGTNTIRLGAGTWSESTTIDKSVTIIGKKKTETFITPGSGNNGFTVDGTFDGAVALLNMAISGGSAGVRVNDTADFGSLVINKVDFTDNELHGVAVFGNSAAATTIKNANFLNNGFGGGSLGEGDILFFGYNGAVKLRGVDIQSNNPTGTADYGIQIRGADPLARSGKIELVNVKVAGEYRLAQIGIQEFSSLRSLNMVGVELGGQTDAGTDSAGTGFGAGSLVFSNIGSGDFSVGDTKFNGGISPFYQHITNFSAANFDATGATFEGVSASDLTVEQSFDVEDKVAHALDAAGLGLVTWQDGSVFVTQQSGSIQRGVDASTVGGNVWVDDGTFAESVNVNKTVKLYGNNKGISAVDGVRVPETIVMPNSPGFYVTADGVTIDGFTVDGSGASGNNGIEVDGVTNFTAQNNILKNNTDTGSGRSASGFTTGIGIFVNNSAGTIDVSENRAENNTDGIRILNSDASALGDVKVANNAVNNNADKGIIINRSDLAQVQSNDLSGNKTGVWIEESANGLVDDNDINSSTQNAVRLRGNASDGNTISNNRIDGSGINGVLAASGADNVKITGNKIANITGDAVNIDNASTVLIDNNDIDVSNNGIRVAGGSNVTISNNEIDDASVAAIHVSSSNDAQINNNDINDNGASTYVDYGILVEGGSSVDVDKNKIEETSIAGIAANNSALVDIDGNTVKDSAEGILVENGSNGFVVSGNTVSNTSENGIKVTSSNDGFVQANNISATSHNGIAVIDSNNATVNLQNVVNGTSSAGISLNRTTNSLVDDNDISNTGGSGVWINRANGSTVSNNDINTTALNSSRGTGSGVHVKSTNGANVLSNDIDNAGIDGVHVEDSNTIKVDGNDIDGPASNGIRIASGTNMTVSNNEVDDASIAAIHVSNADNAQIANNEINDNGASTYVDYGVLVDGGNSVDVDNNKIEETNIAGIQANNTTFIDIDDNLVKDGKGDGIKVDGGRNADIRRNTTRNMSDDGIDVVSHDNVEIEQNTVIRSGDSGITVRSSSSNAFIDNNNVDVAANGIRVTDSDDATISNNEIDDASNAGIYSLRSDDTQIANNEINDNGASTYVDYGILVEGGNSVDVDDNKIEETNIAGIRANNTTFIDIDDNLVKDGKGDAIKVDGGRNADIRRNTVQDMGFDGIEADDHNNVDIEDNIITRVGDNGIEIDDSNNANIIDNEITRASADGINVDGGDNAYITENEIRRSGADGIDVNDNDDVRIIDNLISGTGFSSSNGNGIEVSNSDDSKIKDNDVTGALTDGINIFNSDDAEITGNEIFGQATASVFRSGSSIQGAGRDGIHVEDSHSVVIDNNTVRGDSRFFRKDGLGAGRHGIFVSGGNTRFSGDGVQVTNNKVLGDSGFGHSTDSVGEDGIHVVNNNAGFFGTRPEISGNEVERTGDNGIFVDDSSFVLVDNNDVTRVDGNGIQVINSFSADITDNRISDTGDDGIDVENSAFVDVNDNVITDAGDDGIDVENSFDADVRRNIVTRTFGDGIELTNSFGADIRNNRVFFTGDDGIDIEGAAFVDVNDNIIAFVTNDGIEVHNSRDADIKRNEISATLDDGIDVRNSRNVEIDDNTIRLTVGDGIQVRRSDNFDIDDNFIRFAGDDGIDVEDTDSGEITDNNIAFVTANGIESSGVDDIEISDNVIRRAGMNGVSVIGFDTANIEDNEISDSDDNGIYARNGSFLTITDNDIDESGEDGIQVISGGGFVQEGLQIRRGFEGRKGRSFEMSVEITENDITNSADDGVEVIGANNVLVDSNIIDESGDDGIRLLGFAPFSNEEIIDEEEFSVGFIPSQPEIPSFEAVISNNIVSNSGTPQPETTGETIISIFEPSFGGDGIEVGGFDSITVEGNDVSNSVENGLNVSGPNNGDVVVSDNIFTDNEVGANFESGVIDLTGTGNTFIGGTTGLRFAPFEFDFGEDTAFEDEILSTSIQARPSFPFPIFGPLPESGFAPMELVDNTIGEQTFDGQDIFVELDNEAFFAPGSPTLLSALDSTFVGTPFGTVTPSVDFPNGLTLEQFAFFDARFIDFTETGNTGLFFFPLLPDIDQEDVFQFFSNGGGSLDGFNLTILGLPSVPGASGLSAAALNDIAPAAGGDNPTPEALNAIETAAGGDDTESATCWNDALNAASNGGAVNFSYGSGAEALLNGEASCGS